MSKNSRATGSVTQRRDGRWQACWWEGSVEEGNRVRKFAYADTKTAAKNALRKAMNAVDEGKTGKDSATKFKDYARTWHDSTLPLRNVGETTIGIYGKALDRWILPTLGERSLGSIRKTTIETWLRKLETELKLSSSSRRTAYSVAAMIFESAVDDHLLGHSPMTRVPRPSGKAEKVTPFVEGTHAVAYLKATDGSLRAALLLLVGSGCRINEALTARWSDLEDGVWLIQGTKTDGSLRTVPLPAKIVEQLKAWKAEQSKQRLAAVAWYDLDLIVTNEIGQSPDYSAMRRRFHAASKKAGLPAVGFHSFRHGVASNLLASGVPVNEVAGLLGHQSATTLLKVYAHVLPGRLEAAAAKLDQGLVGL